ncbi:MAG: hypothetical protein IID44_25460 [Planctomycetes bacterium]|nr:hypothetical protein [Planctomycetota bacterium]
MSFDPKKTDGAGAAPVDGLFDDGLPEDLAALGQQLFDDAARLTRAYPADAQRPARSLRWRSVWRSATVLRWSALAASLLVLIGGGMWIAERLDKDPAGGGPVATNPNDAGGESGKPTEPDASQPDRVPFHSIVAFDQTQPGDSRDRLTAEDVLKMTGPKLEAYGDIRADESETMESISF